MDLDDPRQRNAGLLVALLVISGVILAIQQPWVAGSSVPDAPKDIPAWDLANPGAATFASATGWINSAPVNLTDLRGKVVLVDFWTYSCINCIHTFPYLRAWNATYGDHGLVIVGVHTPEFRFERNAANVQNATERYGLTYPVALDNGYGIWSAYGNHYWPAEYLIDQWGRIRYTHVGEGHYDVTESHIRDLLQAAGYDVPTAWANASANGGGSTRDQTPELYAAYAQDPSRVALGNPEGYRPGRNVTYAPASTIQRDLIYVTGTWWNGNERLVAQENTTVTVRFHAGGANFVSDAPLGGCVGVELDGQPIPQSLAGRDVSYAANGTGGNGTMGALPCVHLDAARSYDVFAGPVDTYTLTLHVPRGFTLYTLDFSAQGRT